MPESQVLNQNSRPIGLSTDQIQAKIDLSIALALSTWPALTLAVQEKWGGPDSAEKQEWFAGAISELFESSKDAMDDEYLEEFMLQVMIDEFDVNIEDGSGEEVAELIIKLRKEITRGIFTRLDDMYAAWEGKQKLGNDGKEKLGFVRGQDEDNDVEWDGEGSDSMDMDLDVPSRPSREKPAAEIDEDGFTKVVGRSKR